MGCETVRKLELDQRGKVRDLLVVEGKVVEVGKIVAAAEKGNMSFVRKGLVHRMFGNLRDLVTEVRRLNLRIRPFSYD